MRLCRAFMRAWTHIMRLCRAFMRAWTHTLEKYMQQRKQRIDSMSKKLEYHHRLYLGESISESKLDKIKKKLEKKPLFCNAYLVTISHNSNDQLDVFSAKQLVQSFYDNYPVYVIGITSDYNEAVKLIEQIVKECLQARGDYALKEYLLC